LFNENNLKIYIALLLQFSALGQIKYQDVFLMKNGCVIRGYTTYQNIDNVKLMTIDSVKYKFIR
jgi:hypothetical protein